MKRFLWDHAIPQQVHTPSSFGPAVILKTTDTWVSSLKWPGYCNSWNTQVIRAEPAQIKWRPNPPTTKVYKKVFSHICLSLSWQNQSSDFQKQWRLQPDFCHLSPRSSDNSVTEMTHWRSRQWANPTDLTQRVLNKTWPSPTHHRPISWPAWTASCICLRANATLRQRLQTPGSLCTYALMLGSAGTDADYVINYLF